MVVPHSVDGEILAVYWDFKVLERHWKSGAHPTTFLEFKFVVIAQDKGDNWRKASLKFSKVAPPAPILSVGGEEVLQPCRSVAYFRAIFLCQGELSSRGISTVI